MLQNTTLDDIQDTINQSGFDTGYYQWPFQALPKLFFNPNLVI
jgi:hypothetical protein